MDLIKTAKELGFSDAAIMDTKDLGIQAGIPCLLRGESVRKL